MLRGIVSDTAKCETYTSKSLFITLYEYGNIVEHILISYMQLEYRTFSIVHFVSTHTINDKTQVKIALLHVCKA